jgi:hypothetical protein
MRSSSTSLRSLVMPYKQPIDRMRLEKLGVDRGPARLPGAVLQLFAHKRKADVLFDEPQLMILRNLIFQAEVLEQRFRTRMLPHHDGAGRARQE